MTARPVVCGVLAALALAGCAKEPICALVGTKPGVRVSIRDDAVKDITHRVELELCPDDGDCVTEQAAFTRTHEGPSFAAADLPLRTEPMDITLTLLDETDRPLFRRTVQGTPKLEPPDAKGCGGGAVVLHLVVESDGEVLTS